MGRYSAVARDAKPCRGADEDDVCATSEDHKCPEPAYATTPNALGYTYLQDTLAARGIISASVSANAMNCRAAYIFERAQLLVAHLVRWRSWAQAETGELDIDVTHAVDLQAVGLFGHSRGGDAVANAAALLSESPLAGVQLRGVLAVGPTDFYGVTPSGAEYLAVLPSCDGDVATLDGMHMYDRAAALVDNDWQRNQVLAIGANHCFFK